MNRSHKQQLEKIRGKNDYNKHDLEIAEELLKEDDPIFNEEVMKQKEKIAEILKKKHEQ